MKINFGFFKHRRRRKMRLLSRKMSFLEHEHIGAGFSFAVLPKGAAEIQSTTWLRDGEKFVVLTKFVSLLKYS